MAEKRTELECAVFIFSSYKDYMKGNSVKKMQKKACDRNYMKNLPKDFVIVLTKQGIMNNINSIKTKEGSEYVWIHLKMFAM